MEVTATNGTSYDVGRGRTFTEVIPYSAANDIHSKLKHLFKTKCNNTDALHAVKMDPAVLEAQVTVDTSCKESTPTPEPNAQLPTKKVSETSSTPRHASFEQMVSMQEAALMSLSPQQYELLMKYVQTLRQQRANTQRHLECVFCKNNGESLSWYSSHALKDWRGRVRCPVLRALRCPRCGASGDKAHTLKYCPENFDRDRWSRSSCF